MSIFTSTIYAYVSAVTELMEGDSSRLKSDRSSVRVHNTQRTLSRFEESVKLKALPKKHPRCLADAVLSPDRAADGIHGAALTSTPLTVTCAHSRGDEIWFPAQRGLHHHLVLVA
jgi:hypothetical protein